MCSVLGKGGVQLLGAILVALGLFSIFCGGFIL